MENQNTQPDQPSYLTDGRFVPPDEKKSFVIKSLWARNREIIRRVMLGEKYVEIARDMNITPQTVTNTINSPLARQEIARLEAMRDDEAVDISKDIKEMTPLSLKVLRSMLANPNTSDNVRSKIAFDNLDRAGYGAVKKLVNLTGELTTDDIDEIKQRAIEQARMSGQIIDADYDSIDSSDSINQADSIDPTDTNKQ